MAEVDPLQSNLERVRPHDVDAEEGLLAACIIEGGHETLSDCIQAHVVAESFYRPAHRLIFQALLSLLKEDKTEFDELVLAEKLRSLGTYEEVGGLEYINRLTSRIETRVHATHWMEIVQEKALRRNLIDTCVKTVEDCYDPTNDVASCLEKVEQGLFNLRTDKANDHPEHIRVSMDAASKLVQQQIAREIQAGGIPSGFKDLDGMVQGFQAGQMIVLAARPSVGKTSLGMNFAENAAMPSVMIDPVPTLVFSLEMTAEQLSYRLLCSRARVSMSRLRDGFASKDDQRVLATIASEIKEAPIYIDDASTINIYEMKAKARRLNQNLLNKNAKPLGMILIDYLQLIQAGDKSSSREQQIAEISRAIKGMAKDLELPVIVLSQLNRDMEKEKRDPRLSDLRESGAIEQDAERPDPDQDEDNEEGGGHSQMGPLGSVDQIKLIIAKQRNGPVGAINLSFIRQYTRFENYAH
jgi:replicative DNA helicase